MQVAPGDTSASRDEALYAARSQLHAFIARRVESPEVADDLTQDVLLRVLTRQHDGVEDLSAWFYRVARNAIIDHYRARDSRTRATIGAPPPAEQTEDPFEDDPEQSKRELASCLRPLVNQLAEPYRAAVIAVDLDGRTQAEVAHALGLSVSGMKSRVQRGRIQLRRVLTDCCTVVTTATGSVTAYESVDSQDGGDKCSRGCRYAAACRRRPFESIGWLALEAGEVCGFLGPSGAGKSTTQKHIAMNTAPDLFVREVIQFLADGEPH